jgi:hypothetical protein
MNQPNPVDGKTNVSRTAVEVKYGEYYHSNTGNGVNNYISQLGVTCENYENAVLTRKTNLNKDGLILYNDQTETTNIDDAPIVTINREEIRIKDPSFDVDNFSSINCNGIFYSNINGSSNLSNNLQLFAKDEITSVVVVSTTTLAPSSLITDAPVFDFSFNSLTLGGVSGEAGQVFSVDGSGQPVWTTVSSATPSLSDVLVDGDADQKPISNVLSVALKESTVANPVVLSQDAGGALNLSSATVANVIDESFDTKQFSGKYLKLSINGTDYYFQAFTVPPS